jgi:hypothetical protein
VARAASALQEAFKSLDKNSLVAMSTTISPVAYDAKIEGNVIFTQVDTAINWMRSNSLWPMPMGLACCAMPLATASQPVTRQRSRCSRDR